MYRPSPRGGAEQPTFIRREKRRSSVKRDDLDELERRLEAEVDEDFFQDPNKFRTLHRVIDVLGAQLLDEKKRSPNDFDNLRKNNPAYKALKHQQQVVEDAIEHMAVAHCSNLNGSVVQVGRVSRQFRDAVVKVRELRQQVKDVQESLGRGNHITTTQQGQQTAAQAAAMSLRELWLKKLECEAVLTILSKIEVLRSAPAHFDAYIRPPCHIGAGVLAISDAWTLINEHSVSHVQALWTIQQQLAERRREAVEIIWEALGDVLYLRTGNGIVRQEPPKVTAQTSNTTPKTNFSSAASVGSKRSARNSDGGIQNPFIPRHGRGPTSHELDDDDSVSSHDSVGSFFSQDSQPLALSSDQLKQTRMMIPVPLIDSELDLEADERRCLEDTFTLHNKWDVQSQRKVPRYTDHVLALRVLVECLAKLSKLPDIENHLKEDLERELRKIAQREQARTLARLEKRSKRQHKDMKEFRRHLTGLLSAYGCVMVRLSHLAQIIRHRISTDKSLVLHDNRGEVLDPSTVMHSLLVSAYDIMQREVQDFLRACLQESEASSSEINEMTSTNGIASHESGFFSLGITNDANKKDSGYGALAASRASTLEQPADKFVVQVLFPKTSTAPQVRHALEFRKALSKWTAENTELKKELALVSGQDTTSPSYNTKTAPTALQQLDNVIKEQLIPVLQDDALNGTTHALEREDAFDPVIDRALYGRPNSNEPQDVDMCIACQALYYSTGPVFQALHRLPRDEKMYLFLVGVLEHAILTFISRVKPRVNQICKDKMALRLLLDSGKEGKDKSFNITIERRRAFAQLLQAYANGDLLEAARGVEVGDMMNKDPNLVPLAPPSNDTKSRNGGGMDAKSHSSVAELDLGGGVEREELNFAQELVHLQSLLEFTKESQTQGIVVCSDEDLMKASSLAHSLLKLSSLLESRLKVRSSGSFETVLTSTRALREAIKTIKAHGIKMAKFCRIDMLMQTITRLSKICKSSTIVAKDAVRIPSCVNDLGEYLTAASDNLREASGNAVTAYTLSSLEQYIPLFLMQTVRIIASGEGIVAKSPLTLNGIEALDRSGSVLYRDLKGATSFDNSFWDDELAAISFERSASFMAMMELEMEELEAYYRANNADFTDNDFQLMFAMNGPRRRGDIGRYRMMKKKISSNK